MTPFFLEESKDLHNCIDFLRFALSHASASDLHYGHGTDNPHDEMNSLILRSLALPYDIDRDLLWGRLTVEEKNYLCEQLDKRINQRVPVPYLINEAYFCDLPFYVDERVLIPRSPIAELINKQFSPWIDAENVHRVLDLCTGSGCIAIACCYAFPDAEVHAVDISEAALEVAQINREGLQVEDQLTLIHSDCFANVPQLRYDLIISNPPYVSAEEMGSLPQEFSHEPVLALECENNGLSIVQTILSEAAAHLSENGILVVEVGNSEEALVESYPGLPFTWLEMEYGGHGIFMLTKKQLDEYFNGR